MLSYFHKFANPTIFLRLIKKLFRIFLILSITLISLGLYLGLFASPPDYQQSDSVRIMYLHVPAAWLSLFSYTSIFFLSVFYLIWKFPLFLIIAKEGLILGFSFTLIAMVTGSLWGKPTWGTYWVWDARLTSFFILLFIFLGLLLLKKTTRETSKSDKSFAYLALLGGINLPIIKFSVDWWNTLHQPASVIRTGGPTISWDMLLPLIIMFFGLFFLYLYLLLLNIKSNIEEKKLIVKKQTGKI